MPIGARANGSLLFTAKEVSPNYMYLTVNISLDCNDGICFWLVVGLLVLDSMHAHTRMSKRLDSEPTALFVDAPICIDTGEAVLGRVTVNPNCNTVITDLAQLCLLI